ncbi:uncharacterized protein LOC130624118 isoform X1 [Hydractinia symbiolongicarpus]|uniref:uncharacterized protein LOC130624118 isoform X1 n=1 Tax=Hydractinia symbiolongicarpus TaxID=13093 RepID=UPI0025504FEE|nr:uncharacterized protein LOC130624118 isoform X1 [Hydractinia symbiolongicarpus]
MERYIRICLLVGFLYTLEAISLNRKEILDDIDDLLDDSTLAKISNILKAKDVVSAIMCEDDPKVSSACKHWKQGGACENNRDVMRQYCRKTCNDCKAPAPPVPEVPECASNHYGCCWDNVTVARGPTNDIVKSQCPPCLDKQSKTFCEHWKSDCTSPIIGQGDVMKKICPGTCGVPCGYNMNINICRDDPANVQNCIKWYDEGKCTTEQSKLRVLCPSMCGFCHLSGKK